MSVKIRLSRFGAKKQPSYRIVVTEEHSKRDGRIVEKIGHYDPRTKPATVVLNEERTKYWLGVGARPTDAMGPILKQAGISDKYVRCAPRANRNLPRKKKRKRNRRRLQRSQIVASSNGLVVFDYSTARLSDYATGVS